MQIDLGISGYQDPVEIGRGGFGVVYRARQPKFNRDVAIKVLGARPDTDALTKFERECQTLGTLSGHPNIVEVFDAGLTDAGLPYLVTAFISGGTLAERLARTGTYTVAEALEITIKLSGALATAHAHNILHRDVKPENVLLSPYGEPLLVDFGLARLEGEQTRSQAGSITASLAHAAPEILSGHTASPASDVYSLGSSLFTLFARRPPFVRDTDESVLPLIARVLDEPVPDLRPVGVPADVCACIEAAMVKDPAARIASAQELGERLQASQARNDLRVTPIPISSPDGLAVTRVVASAPPPPTRTAAPPAMTPPPPATPETPVTPPSEPPASSRRRRVVPAAAGAVLVAVVIAFVALRGGGGGSVAPRGTTTPSAPATTADAAVVAAAQIQKCQGAHGLQTARDVQHPNDVTTVFASCAWPPGPGADPDGFTRITVDSMQGPGQDEASGASSADYITFSCKRVRVAYDFGKQGAFEHLPPFELAAGTVAAPGPQEVATPWTGPAPYPYPERNQAVYVRNGSYLVTDAECVS